MIQKVIIPAAGLGTRLFPATKEQPKEMLPIFTCSANGEKILKPVVQMVFEQLYKSGIQEFCYVVGRGKRVIEDHFMADNHCLRTLEGIGMDEQASDLNDFFMKLNTSTIMWVNQSEPKGFGDAVLMAKPFAQNEPCLIHAGDSYILSKNMDYISKLLEVYEKFSADAAFIILEIDKPKQYGIIEGIEVDDGVFRVETAIEKPKNPRTNLAIMAMYVFKPTIFPVLEIVKNRSIGEIQLTDAIQKLVDVGSRVFAIKLDDSYSHIDVGSPERYWEALELTYKRSCRGNIC